MILLYPVVGLWLRLLNKMDNYTKWLSAIFDEMNELFPRELEIARIKVNRRLRGEEE